MHTDARDPDPMASRTGLTRLVAQDGSIILVDWDLRDHARSSGSDSPQLDGGRSWLHFTEVGLVQIGSPARFVPASRVAGVYISSIIVAIDAVVPARELSAEDLTTARFIGEYIIERGPRPWAGE